MLQFRLFEQIGCQTAWYGAYACPSDGYAEWIRAEVRTRFRTYGFPSLRAGGTGNREGLSNSSQPGHSSDSTGSQSAVLEEANQLAAEIHDALARSFYAK